jgi:hypothetical protein
MDKRKIKVILIIIPLYFEAILFIYFLTCPYKRRVGELELMISALELPLRDQYYLFNILLYDCYIIVMT